MWKWLRGKAEDLWGWAKSQLRNFYEWCVIPQPLKKKVGQAVWMTMKIASFPALILLSLKAPLVVGLFASQFLPNLKDPTSNILLQFVYWFGTVGAYYYFAEAFWAIVVFGAYEVSVNVSRTFEETVDEYGFYDGIAVGAWRSLGYVLEPLVGELYKRRIRNSFVENGPKDRYLTSRVVTRYHNAKAERVV